MELFIFAHWDVVLMLAAVFLIVLLASHFFATRNDVGKPLQKVVRIKKNYDPQPYLSFVQHHVMTHAYDFDMVGPYFSAPPCYTASFTFEGKLYTEELPNKTCYERLGDTAIVLYVRQKDGSKRFLKLLI